MSRLVWASVLIVQPWVCSIASTSRHLSQSASQSWPSRKIHPVRLSGPAQPRQSANPSILSSPGRTSLSKSGGERWVSIWRWDAALYGTVAMFTKQIHSDRTHTPIVSETLLAFASHLVSRVNMDERRGSRGRNYTRPNPDLSSVSPAVQPPVIKCLAKEFRLRMLINPTLPVVIASALANLT